MRQFDFLSHATVAVVVFHPLFMTWSVEKIHLWGLLEQYFDEIFNYLSIFFFLASHCSINSSILVIGK